MAAYDAPDEADIDLLIRLAGCPELASLEALERHFVCRQTRRGCCCAIHDVASETGMSSSQKQVSPPTLASISQQG